MGGSSGGGGGGDTTTVQKADPWSGQQPYLTAGFQGIQQQFKDTPPTPYFPGQTVAPFSPETDAALQLQTQRALMGSPVSSAATQQLTDTMNGNYLYGGDGFNAAVDAASHKILPQVGSQFEMAGRTNSGLADVAKTQALSDSFANQYAAERQNQMRGMLFAPTMANQDYTDIGQLASVGATKENMDQSLINDAINRYDYTQNANKNQAAQFMNLIQGNFGGTTTTTSPLYQNRGAGALGGALAGSSLASAIGSAAPAGSALSGLAGPWGLGIGAGLGLLGGLF